MQTTKTPDELLIRWRDGKISGAHVRWLYAITDGGNVVSEQSGSAEPVSISDDGTGFPIADILPHVESGAIERMNDEIALREKSDEAKKLAELAYDDAMAESRDLHSRIGQALREVNRSAPDLLERFESIFGIRHDDIANDEAA